MCVVLCVVRCVLVCREVVSHVLVVLVGWLCAVQDVVMVWS